MKTVKLSTPVPLEPSPWTISHDDHVFLLGSCFTENMGLRLQTAQFSTCINPSGILYNPVSMAVTLSNCLDGKLMDEIDDEGCFVHHDGLWHSWMHHGSFSRREKKDCIDACNEKTCEAHAFLEKCNTLVLTFGSAWCYELIDGAALHFVVANCHKVPDNRFRRRLLLPEEIVSLWVPLLRRLGPERRVIITISPVRHSAYGAHGNQLGKASLLLATDELCKLSDSNGFPQISYFPAYEIVVDELRDYRFYADDMAHPSPLAELIVWSRFQETFMSKETVVRCEEAEKAARRAAHRPLH